MGTPLFRTFKHGIKQLPLIPEIIGDPPHIRDLLIKLSLFQKRRAGRKTQHHIPSAAFEGIAQHHKLRFFVRELPAKIVTLDKINAPCSIQLKYTIIICLCSLFFRIHAVHIRIPATNACGFCDFTGSFVRTQNACILMNCLSWNAPHDMDPELESQPMHILSQGRKALSSCGRREPVFVRDQP